jgi:hypothetical protein
MITVHDVNDRRLDFYRDLRHAQTLHTRSKVFLTDGEKITLSILQSSLHVHSILLTQELYEKHLSSIQSKIPAEECYVMSKKDMDILVGFDLHSPMMSIVEEPASTSLSSMKGPIIALNGIVNSDNGWNHQKCHWTRLQIHYHRLNNKLAISQKSSPCLNGFHRFCRILGIRTSSKRSTKAQRTAFHPDYFG